MTYPETGPVTLRVNLADSPMTAALKSGDVTHDLVRFDDAGPAVAYQGFKPMVREGAFDAGELAIVTYLQAREHGKPWIPLPIGTLGRFQHAMLVYNSDRRPAMSPRDLAGKRVGIRSYTQTTGMWIRGHLAHDYGVDLSKVQWVCWDDPHVAEYADPPFVERVPAGSKTLEQMLSDGDIDAAIPGQEALGNPVNKPVIPDAPGAARLFRDRYVAVPVNHLFVVKRDLAQSRPDVLRAIFDLLLASKTAAGMNRDIDDLPFGLAALRPSLELAIRYSLEQQLIARPVTVDALFDEVTRVLEP